MGDGGTSAAGAHGQAGAPGRTLAPPPAGAPLHARSFKLRFAAQCEPGRSYVSAVKPLALPATVTDKFHRREREMDLAAALQRVEDMFRCGPRDKYPEPLTTSHEYGWWAGAGAAGGGRPGGGGLARLDYRIRDSAWLKARVHLLAADAGYKR